MTENHRQDMQRMQRDAENRIREMQRKAERAVSGTDMPPVPNFVKVDNRQKPPLSSNPMPSMVNQHNRPAEKPQQMKENRGINLLKMLDFSKLKLDKDIMLIAVMILLLSSGEGDELLLMALLYIML